MMLASTGGYHAIGAHWCDRAGIILLLLVLCAPAGGCANHKYLEVRRVPRNPLDAPLNLLSHKGPQPTERTVQTLRKYDLEKLQKKDPDATLVRLQKDIAKEPTADKLQAFSELAYIAAYKADAVGNDARALNLYGVTVFYAYDYLFDPLYDALRNPYDPQFRRACDLYNTGLEAAMRLIDRQGQLLAGESLMFDTGVEPIRVEIIARGSWKPEDFEKLEFVSDYQITGLKNHHHSYGLGVPMIAVRRPGSADDPAAHYYPATLTFPVTAFLRVLPVEPGVPNGKGRRCILELCDPLDSSTTMVANRLVPLETDLSTPLGYNLEKGRTSRALEISTLGLLNPDKVKSMEGLYMVEPFDPNKIPVLMVHGLWSSPMTWMEMFNDLLAYPEIRSNYQFWFYLYPTGQPFWKSSMDLRAQLVQVRQDLDPHQANPAFDQMVLVGHSMGGLVAMMQTLESGDDFWNILSDRPFDELHADPETRAKIAQTVFFQPSPSVQEVITIGTPHHGSTFANEYTRFLARKLISLPASMLGTAQRLTLENPGFFRDTDLLKISTSIDSLAPNAPIFPVMLAAKRAPWVSYHNVVGVMPEDSFWSRFAERGDGVVEFESAHRDDFQSELVVDADHLSVQAHPLTILEVRRILLEHLGQVRPWVPTSAGAGADDRYATVPAGAGGLPGAAPGRPAAAHVR
jgi:pimeloyl-ACP methyl ester carboxylesterase